MSIGISHRVILDNDGVTEISVESDKNSLCISSGWNSQSSGHITFEPEQLPELIEVLQTFLKERSV